MYIHCLPSGKIINVIRPFKVLITQKKVTCETSCCEKALFYGPHVQISVVLIAAFCVKYPNPISPWSCNLFR